jgi:hypothetical protein
VWNEAGEEAEVTMRVLNSGDKAEVEDTQGVIMSEDGESATPDMRMGAMKHLIVNRAVVNWTLPVPPPTPALIASLPSGIFDQIFALTTFGAPPEQPKKPKKGDKPRPPQRAGAKPALTAAPD